MTNKSLLTKLCTIVRVVWRFTASIFQESSTKDNWCELFKLVRKIWKDRDAAYNSLDQGGDKKKYLPLKQGILSLPGGNSRTGNLVRILFMSCISGIIFGVAFGAFVLFVGGFTWGGLILIVVFIFLLSIIPVLNYQANTYYLGYLGERAVAEELDNLISQHDDFPSQQWRFFHSFFPEKESKGDIDHVIVCPKGIFCVETKTRRKNNDRENVVNFKDGTLTINDLPNNKIIEQVKGNARRMHHFLQGKCDKTGYVKSIITFPNWQVLSDNPHDAPIFVINPGQFYYLFRSILSQNKYDTLNQEQIDKISKAIKDRDRSSLEQIKEILS